MSPGCDESCCYWVDVGIPVNIENELSKRVLVDMGVKSQHLKLQLVQMKKLLMVAE